MQLSSPRLLVVAHGTAAPAGSATTARLVAAIATARPDVAVSLCFLDVAAPRLAAALDAQSGPSVVLPLLLSTGYHVQTDIPAAVAVRADVRADVRIARHLGPHPLLVDVLAERLPPLEGASTVLVGAGSSRREASTELTETGALLAQRLGQPVTVLTLTDELRAAFEALPGPVRVATYLLAEGRFVATLRAAVEGLGLVAEPIGVHPALVDLVWTRYDDALR